MNRRNVLAGLAVGAGVVAINSRPGAAQPREKIYKIEIKPDEMILGKPDAPVTIVEYASLTCDHCGAFHRDKMPLIKKGWLDTGKARLVYRDFPFNAAALKAAMLARCGADGNRDRYYALISVFFEQQENWSHAKDPMAALAQLAKVGGIGDARFKACTTDSTVEKRILEIQLEGQNAFEVKSTPTFFINGRRLVGNLSYSEFEKALQAAVEAS